MPLNDKEFNIVLARIMFKTDWKLALSWLKSKGYDTSQSDYYRTLAVLDQQSLSRLNELGRSFTIVLADELVKIQSIEKQLYEEYHKEPHPINRARILKMILEMQPYLTAIITETRSIIENNAIKQKDNILSTISTD